MHFVFILVAKPQQGGTGARWKCLGPDSQLLYAITGQVSEELHQGRSTGLEGGLQSQGVQSLEFADTC